MNAKQLFWSGLERFKARNDSHLLTHAILQSGANERWLAREFALAMQSELLDGRLDRQQLKFYVDCEKHHVDIAVLDGDDRCSAVYEVKALYNFYPPNELTGIVAKAHGQLETQRIEEAERRIALFFAVYRDEGEPDAGAIKTFETNVRNSIRGHFHSDHDIRLTELTPLSEVKYLGAATVKWHAQSWITWGYPK